MKNRVWVYSVAYNESHFVKNFLAGYAEAERIIVYDNMSTDKTMELLLQDPRVEIRTFNTDNTIRDDLYLEIKNYAWMEARGKADWVIVVDFDEIFNRAEIINGVPQFNLDFRDVYKMGYNMIKPYGYNMISLDSPMGAEGHPFQYSQKATYHVPEEKLCCFRPDEIFEMRYYTGCHRAEPLDMGQSASGVKICSFPWFKLMHFKFWNLEHYMARMAEYQTRMSDWNKKMGAGWHYMETLEWHEQCFRNGEKLAQYLFDVPKPE